MHIDRLIDESLEAVESVRGLKEPIANAVDLLVECLDGGNKVLACGNGGSAADASHFTTELLCRFVNDRPSLPALSLNCDGSFLTATSNDYGYDFVFSRQIEGLGKPGDVVVGISTSGNSPTVLGAFKTAKERGLKTISMLGRDGGKAAGMTDVELIVPIFATARIQEAHTLIIHLLRGGIESRLFPELSQS